MTSETLLIVDDEPAVLETLRLGLEAEGWNVLVAADVATARGLLETQPVDLIALDIFLGADDGLDLAAELRTHRNIPVLIVTGCNEPFDRLKALESGADDYVLKPFLIREVVLRIRRVLESYRRDLKADVVAFDALRFDVRRQKVTRDDGSGIDLTGMELQLLELFVRHPGRVLSRDEICRALLGREWSPFDRTIDGHIARLRRKIEPPGEAPVLIRSVRGVGYVFSADVRLNPPPGPEEG